MPKILINEKDRTSPGTPSGYANFSVLITGYIGDNHTIITDADVEAAKLENPESTLKADAIQPDSNGAYEFSSVQDFIDTIGLAKPERPITVGGGNRTEFHYGNQMAYELLNMGYTIIYKPIESILDMATETFWKPFEDKASYDFRFVTHGLLKSSKIPSEQLKKEYEEKVERLADVNAAIEALQIIRDETTVEKDATTVEDLDERETLYETTDKSKYPGLTDPSTKSAYSSFEAADAGTKAEAEDLQTDINQIDEQYITTNKINIINGFIANLASYNADKQSGRGDCTALIELDERRYTTKSADTSTIESVISAINEMTQINKINGQYCAMTVPSVQYKMADNKTFGNNKTFPGAFHYLACFINSLSSGFAEWYAAAGYTRGVSSYVIDKTSVKFGEIAINALEPRFIKSQSTDPKFACNVIANFRGSYYLWGNRTAYELAEYNGGGDLVASHFLNIRQLCSTIKKQLYVACRRFTFDPNSDTLWVNFCNAIRPTLETMKADQGIRDYKILKVYEDNPKKATLKAKIRIIPIEAVEDFDLEVSLEDSFGETAVVATEPSKGDN